MVGLEFGIYRADTEQRGTRRLSCARLKSVAHFESYPCLGLFVQISGFPLVQKPRDINNRSVTMDVKLQGKSFKTSNVHLRRFHDVYHSDILCIILP